MTTTYTGATAFNQDDDDDDDYFTNAGWCVKYKDIELHIKDQGSWARDLLASLPSDLKAEILQSIAYAAVELISGLEGVQAERDSNNDVRGEVAPSIMPYELATMRTSDFIEKV